ncbi:MAG: 1,4-alpha-glucan branching protein GlgB [Desulfovibrionaceae bacterium]|nr:1,4-alpha-glucan branching protein GlgB [Desulfovibrionaceae bacterium]
MRRPHEPRYGASLLTDHDIYLFKEGNHFDLHDKLGSHPMTVDGEPGTLFAVWAPNAAAVSVVGDFNGWDPEGHPLAVRHDGSGIWEGFLPGIGRGTLYKYHIVSAHGDYRGDKGDPFARFWETSPKTASIVWDLDYQWTDGEWMAGRRAKNAFNAPMSIYEVHLGSFAREMGDRYRSLSYLELADRLTEHVLACGFTHVEFLPVMEHPFFGSWGYQTLGYFAPTSRFGTPQDFMALIDRLHQAGIGVILDWVPSHFPTDGHGLAYFDGTHLFEHADPRRGYHPDWNCYIFNTGRYEVRAFLISSAMFWLSRYHADGLRVDAVASMLYLDYSRKDGEWIPNIHGGRENLDNIAFFQKLNEAAYTRFPDIQTMAEESTAWPMVSRPPYIGGLGFGMKWNMGWMHDTLRYFSRDPIHRKFHHGELTFGIWYAFTENFILPLSHDEVVYGKGSLLGKMPGDDWQKFANLRLLYALMYAHPGKKLLFMGAEIAQWGEWNHDAEIDWRLLEYRHHRGIMTWVKDLNALYRREPALHERDFESSGFEWVDFRDAEASVVAFLRKGKDPRDMVLGVFNFTPVSRPAYRVGVPVGGVWTELLNSDADVYGGSGLGNAGAVAAQDAPGHGHPYSLEMVLPPLSAVLLTPQNWR